MDKKSKNRLLVIIIAAAAVVILAGLGFVYFFVMPRVSDTGNTAHIEANNTSRRKKKKESESSDSWSIFGASQQAAPAAAEGSTGGVGWSMAAAAEAYEEAPIEKLSADTVEGQLQERIMEMNDGASSLQYIDVFADNYRAGARNTGYKWDSTVFYTLEGLSSGAGYFNKNLCELQKKELINAVTGNIIDYEIYINPDTGVANKIVSIEYLDEGIEVMEYYFNNAVEVSFVYRYQTDNYVSSYATPDRAGERFLYSNDVLTTWRVIDTGKMNYAVGDAEAKRLKGQWKSNEIVKYSSLDAAGKNSFDEMEEMMIDAAYNTYYTVMNAEGIARIMGSVYDGNMNGYPNASVELYSDDFGSAMYRTTTDSDGEYTIYVPNETYTYNLRVKDKNKRECRIHAVNVDNGQIGAFQDTVYLFDDDAPASPLTMILGDAFNYNESGSGMMLLNNARVNIRQGINNRYGALYLNGITDSSGYFSAVLDPGVYTVEVIADGYETMYYNVVVNPNRENNYEFYAAPTLSDGEYAIVLTWGESPSDLDSHLFTTRGSETNHIWYGNKTDSYGSWLDVDDTTSYGPETVTIRDFNTSDYYKYAVVDYTDCSMNDFTSYNMSQSGATVNVYSADGLIGTFHVPTNIPGVIWEIFEIRQGVVTPIQRYYNNVVDKDWWHSDK